jgi:putative ABC transport system permease protein
MMLKTTLAGLLAHKARLLMTALAITLGVGFISGTFVLTDTIQAGYDQQFAGSAGKVAVAVLPDPASDEEDRTLSPELLPKLRGLPGVTAAHGVVHGNAALVGKDGRVYGDSPTVGLSLAPPGPLRRYQVVTGKAPASAAEAVLTKSTAKATGYRVGDTIKVLDPQGRPHPFRLVGTVTIGVDSAASLYGAVGFTPDAAAVMTGNKGYTEIDLAGTVSKDTVAAAAGGSQEVVTGQELGDRLAAENGLGGDKLRTILLMFGLVSLLVSAIVIYNTFAILIAQRMRELALLRCVGATRRQVFGGVVVEAVVIGLIGSLLGIAVGAVLGAGALLGIKSAGADLPAGAYTLGLRTVVVALPAGVVITVISALLPARAATRVAPVTALRQEPEPGTGHLRLGWLRTAVAVVLGCLGLGLTGLGTFALDPGQDAMLVTALGGALTILGVIALMPALVRPLAGLFGAVPARLAGASGRLAMENSRRSPKRTATTTIALTIGVGLMTLFAVMGGSVKATVAHELEQQFPVDYALQGQSGADVAMPRTLAESLRADPRVGSVTEVRMGDVRVDGTRWQIGTVTRSSLGTVIKPKVTSGSFAALRPGTIAMYEGSKGGARVGQTFEIITPHGPRRVTVSVVYGGDTPLPGAIVPESDHQAYFGAVGDEAVYVKAKAGTDAAGLRPVIDAAVKPYPAVKVASAGSTKDDLSGAIDTMLMVFGGMLGLAIVIALFGIANTLTLSVVERTRESALLRALGLTRGQLRRMLSVEAMIMAMIGALTGVVLGIVFGWAGTRSAVAGMLFRLPYAQVIGFVVLAGLAGVMAAVLPARRAARASIVESLAAE